MIDFVSRSMNPAPSRKNCQDHEPGSERMTGMTSTDEAIRTSASASR
jgi:hypothetical protein